MPAYLLLVLRALTILGALALAGVGLGRLPGPGAVAPLLMLAGLIVAGPLESWLKASVARRGPASPQLLEAVDQGTSLALVATLVAAALLCG